MRMDWGHYILSFSVASNQYCKFDIDIHYTTVYQHYDLRLMIPPLVILNPTDFIVFLGYSIATQYCESISPISIHNLNNTHNARNDPIRHQFAVLPNQLRIPHEGHVRDLPYPSPRHTCVCKPRHPSFDDVRATRQSRRRKSTSGGC